MNNIKIVLENGVVIPCRSFGKRIDIIGDFIFNTALVGYQEVLTDPSYHKEIVVMSFPVQGIYGINKLDNESTNSSPSGFVVQEYEPLDFVEIKSKTLIEDFLRKKNIQGAAGVDTRYLTKILRQHGTMKGAIVDIKEDEKMLIKKIKSTLLNSHVNEVSPSSTRVYAKNFKRHIVFLDFGAKDSIIKNLVKHKFKITRVNYQISFEEIEKLKPDIVFLSNGPGDPSELVEVSKKIKRLIDNDFKIAGICLGHQLIGQALGAKTFKLKFGHHSINHPVINHENQDIYITSQNHNYAIDEKTINKDISVIMRSLHDNTISGIKHKNKKIISVQFHPESSPGPNDANKLFKYFFEFLLKENPNAKA